MTTSRTIPPASAAGSWGHGPHGASRLELARDGTFSGTDGCNRLFGSWSQDGPSVEFAGVGSTRMACPDVDTWLAALHTGRVDGDVLHISNTRGDEIGALSRAR